MTSVTAKDGEHIEKLLRRFKKKVEEAGILKDARKREHYLKPSIRKKQKQAAALKQRQRSASRKKKRSK